MLGTAHRILDGELIMTEVNGKLKKHWKLPDNREDILYKVSHQSHPCNIWLRQSSGNYKFLYSLLKELCTEYRIRYGRGIKNNEVFEKSHVVENLLPYLKYTPDNIPNLPFIEPSKIYQAMPEKYKHDDFITAYRNYYVSEKELKYNLKYYAVEKNKLVSKTYEYSVPSILQQHKFIEK
jgi:hypothetical protein